MSLRTMAETHRLIASITSDRQPLARRLWYIHEQQLHATRLVQGGAFAHELYSGEAAEARVTQLFLGRSGLVVQLALHEFLLQFETYRYETWRAQQSVLLIDDWNRAEALWFDFQLQSAKSGEALKANLQEFLRSENLTELDLSAMDDDSARWQLVALMPIRRNPSPHRLAYVVGEIVQRCQPHLAPGFEGVVDLKPRPYGGRFRVAPRECEHYFPPPDEQFWRWMLPERQVWLAEATAGEIADVA